MNTALKVMFYLAVGLALLGVNLWFIRSIQSAIQRRNMVIAPFEVIGRTDDGGKLGRALAQMLQAQMTQIQRDMETSQKALIEASHLPYQPGSTEDEQTVSILPSRSIRAVSIPTDLLDPVTINVEVSGVEVSGLVSRLQRWVLKERTLSFSIHYEDERAIVVGSLNALGITEDNPLWLETSVASDEIATDLAYALTRKILVKNQVREIDALTPGEFRTLVDILRRAAELNRCVEIRCSAKEGFASLLSDVEPLTTKMPHWYALIRLAADIAESAEAYEKALEHYQKLDQLAGETHTDKVQLAAKIQEMARRLGIELPGASPVDKVRLDAAYAVECLNEMFGMDLEVPEVVLADPPSANAYWDGKRIHVGPEIQFFPDITYAQVGHMAIREVVNLKYAGQSGAVHTSYSDIFASLCKQRKLGQTAETADWLIAPGFVAVLAGESPAGSADGGAVRSLKAPGTAYDSAAMGKDPQPDHMRDYVDTLADNGGVHINSGIPSKAFYETAIRIGSDAAGKIWYQALLDLTPTSDFQTLASATYQAAAQLYGEGSEEQEAISAAWQAVGISV